MIVSRTVYRRFKRLADGFACALIIAVLVFWIAIFGFVGACAEESPAMAHIFSVIASISLTGCLLGFIPARVLASKRDRMVPKPDLEAALINQGFSEYEAQDAIRETEKFYSELGKR